MDIAQLLARPHDMNGGDAARYLEGFAAEMASFGYSPLTIVGYLDSVIHFGGWLQARGLSLTAIDEKIVRAFGAHRCKCSGRRSYPSVSRAYGARVERFVRYLAEQGIIRSTVNAASEVPSSLIAFREWLLQHRGLAPVTVDRHERLLKQMLPALGAETGQYTAATVRAAVLGQIRGRQPAYAKTFVGALRIYLRFLATSGVCQAGLDHALPTVAEWKLSSLPRYLDSGQTARLDDSCRRDGPLASRDRAIMLLLLRLGLRAGDIASMRPADIDWQEATLLVRGKGRRDVRLPLPQDAGDAVLEYLEHQRPHVKIDRVFLCANAPFRALRSGGAVSDIVRGALRAAGIENPPTRGANLIRHTTATTMLRAGATLDEIGTILRHKSPDTTAHYAKVDVATLQQITQPWPGFKEGK
jgi:site-specific recombinase XerD